MQTLLQDLRYAARSLRRAPGFAAAAVLTLALGIGATTAIVSVAKTAVFDPVPARHPDRLVQLGFRNAQLRWYPGINPRLLRDARRQTDLFARVAAYDWDALTFHGDVFPEPVRGSWVTPEFFSLWNLRPLLGRTFAPDEGRAGKDDVIVISHGLWQRRFGGDPAIVGRTIPFRERPMTVVGVMPPQFSFPRAEYEYWRPAEGPGLDADEFLPNTQVIAQLQPGVDTTQMQAFLDVLTQRQAQEYAPGGVFPWAFQVRLLREMFSTPELRRTLGLLLAAIAFVLFIAAANVANLQLARTESRQQELAVRASLGAGRARVFRQLLTENLLLALLGGAAGLAVAAVGLDLLQKLIPDNVPRLKPIVVNGPVLAVAASVTLATGLLFGLAPAWTGPRFNPSAVLKLGAATSTRDPRRGWLSRGLIVGQVALALVLLAGAGLMVRSVVGLLRVNPGLDPRHVVRVYPSLLDLQARRFSPDPALNQSQEASFAFFADARQRVAAVPGVIDAGVAFEGRETQVSTARGAAPARVMTYWIGVEESDPLRVMRVALKRGRWLDRGDVGEGVGNVLVNEAAARRLWPGEDAVGKILRQEGPELETAYQVVGIVGDTRDHSNHVAPMPIFYRVLQRGRGVDTAPKYLVVRTTVDPASLYKPIGQALKAAGSDPRMPEFYNLEEVLRSTMAGHRILMSCLILFAGVGLLLAAVGLYGVLAFSVARRTREIGIRMALGARFADVMRLVVGQGLALLAAGGVIGMVIALASARALRAYLFGVTSTDPVTFATVAAVLAAVSLLACWLPARRAACVDPMVALRHE